MEALGSACRLSVVCGVCTLSAVQCIHECEARGHIKGYNPIHTRSPYDFRPSQVFHPPVSNQKVDGGIKAWEEETVPYLEDHSWHGNLGYKAVLNPGGGLGPKLGTGMYLT